MEPLFDVVARLGIFFGGLLVRLLVFVGVLALVSVPILVLIGGVEGIARLRRWAMGIRRVGAMLWRPGVYYAPGHVWIAAERGRSLRLGLDDLAQRLLPGPIRVSLPAPGTSVRRGDPVTTIGVDRQQATIPSPVSGTVVAVNKAVGRDPSLLHRDPYVRGWLVRIRPADRSYEEWPREEPARRWLMSEAVRLERMLEQELGYAAADGGALICPSQTLLRTGTWRRLVDAFLRHD